MTKVLRMKFIFLIWLSVLSFCHGRTKATPKAVVQITPGYSSSVTGELVVRATSPGVTVTGQIRGLTPGLHGIHVHEFPDLANGCRNAGGHFNPFDEPHGDPRDLRRHVGDFGNIAADDHGIAHVHVVNAQASLDPDSKAYIGNLSMVVYGGEDDLGRSDHPDSLLSGNAGARVGCGLILVQKQQPQPQPQQRRVKRIPEALVRMVPGSAPSLGGELRIRPIDNGINILGQITGLTPGEHGFHIHAIGELGNQCKDAGGHYNPFGVTHGAPDDAVRHVGDLGNIVADDTGTSYLNITDGVASLDPSSPAYVGDLSVVVHAGKDDLGRGGNPESLKTGNAGARSGCGIIEIQDNHPSADISIISQQKQDLELIEMHKEPTQVASISEITVMEKEQALSVLEQSPQSKTVARVQMIPGSAQDLAGHLTITSSPVAGIIIEGQITGLAPGLHGFHIHEKGDLGNGCKNAGGHFNPFSAQHGAPEDVVRHVGDLGNILADATGKANINISDVVASLDSKSQAYIGGLSFVVHAGEDDLGKGGNPGSLKTGNAGARSGCGLILVDQEQQTQKQSGHDQHEVHQQKQRSILVESARVSMVPGNNPRLGGNLAIESTPTGVLITGQIMGLVPGLHGFHIHEKGDLGNGCKNAGGHFNPFGTQHGAPEDAIRHVGDLGNILADDSGTADINIRDVMASLDPHSEAYIGGLSFVVHAGEDDLGKGGNPGSLKTGNAGGRSGCGLIEVEELFKPITFPDPEFRFKNDDFGVVQIVPGSNMAASGELTITPREDGIAIRGFITGLPSGLHGFHIHEKGDLGNGCLNAGGHFNPFGASHGGPEDVERHVGDLGNILADESGTAYIHINDKVASMNPTSEAYIGNLSVVIHAGEDDLGRGGDSGSLKTGNAGGREACGFIRVETFQAKDSEIRQTPTVLDAAVVRLSAGQASSLSGELSFSPTSKGVHITGQIAGLPAGTHKLHLQPTADFTNGCMYTTRGSDSVELSRDIQVGNGTTNRELGPIMADGSGTVVLNIVDNLISLDPSSRAYIGNMSVIITRDEIGDLATLLGCGTIPHLNERVQVLPVQEQHNLNTYRRRKRRFVPAELIVPYPDPFHTAPSGHYEESGKEAIVKIIPGNSSTVHGNLNIKDVHTGLLIKGVIKGLSSGLHGFHIHERGGLGNKCQDAGGHFNPFDANHGDVSDFERHVGDLGNIKADAKGVAHIHIFDPKGSLDPHSKAFVGHRTVVVHANPDDLGRGKNEDSKRTGNSGTRVGCGIVTLIDKKGTHHHSSHGHGHHQPHSGHSIQFPRQHQPHHGQGHVHSQQPQRGYSVQRHLHDQPHNEHGHVHHQQPHHGHAHHQQQGHGHAHHQQPQHGHGHHQQAQHRVPHHFSNHDNVQLHPGHSNPHQRVHHNRNVDLHDHKPAFNPFPEHSSFFHHSSPSSLHNKHEKVAHAKVIPGNSTHVQGDIEIIDVHTGLIVKGVIKGLSPGLHGFHIHERGGLGNKCQDAGGHFNPFKANHGDVTDFERHVGDLGNIKANSHGVAHIHIFDPKGSLDAHSQAFVGHRAVVVHANPDDLGRGKNEDSKRTGNSGTRLGCGIITPIDKRGSHHHHHHPLHQGHSSNFHVIHSRQTQTQPFHHPQQLSNPGYGIRSESNHHDVPVYHRKKKPQLALEKTPYGPARGYIR